MDASVFCIDVGVLLGLAEVHSDRVHGAGEPWGGAEARSKILRVWVGSGVLEGGHMKVVDGVWQAVEPPKCPATEPAVCQQSMWDTNMRQ